MGRKLIERCFFCDKEVGFLNSLFSVVCDIRDIWDDRV